MRGFSILLGITALTFGLARFAGLDLPVFPVLLIALGSSIIWSVLRESRSAV
jgi:hypothetical protein